MGPPAISPFSSVVRNLTAKQPSAYFVAIPTKAAIHIQKTAPGPPAWIAVATPTILPVPTVAAKAVHKALKLSISPSPLFSAVKISFKACGNLKNWINCNRIVSIKPVPIKSTNKGGPHTKLSILFNTSVIIVSSLLNKKFLLPKTPETGTRKDNTNRLINSSLPSVLLPER